jgi:hypothetical protein
MLLILMNCQEPLKLQFTNTVSCNYELGVQVCVVAACINEV